MQRFPRRHRRAHPWVHVLTPGSPGIVVECLLVGIFICSLSACGGLIECLLRGGHYAATIVFCARRSKPASIGRSEIVVMADPKTLDALHPARRGFHLCARSFPAPGCCPLPSEWPFLKSLMAPL